MSVKYLYRFICASLIYSLFITGACFAKCTQRFNEEVIGQYSVNLAQLFTETSTQNRLDAPHLKIGGAVRLNYAWQDYNIERKNKVGDFGFELFCLDINSDWEDVFMSTQYRWYANFDAIHHAYFGYRFSRDVELHVGIHQVPFGLLPYASHSFWFGTTYYLGFEDDYDSGLKININKDDWNIQAAFYKNPEYISSSRAERYSFDLVTSEDENNEEINQGNLRVSYNIENDSKFRLEIGSSLELGQIYNRETTEIGNRYAFAFHGNLNKSNWNLQLQWLNYLFNPSDTILGNKDYVLLGAFEYPFLIAKEANVYTANISHSFPLSGKPINEVSLYVDYSTVQPTNIGDSSAQLVTGGMIVLKKLYIYVDWINGWNMWFSGGPGIGLDSPDSDEMNSRLNINLGYYF